MHIVCHVSVVVLSGSFKQCAWRDNPTAIEWKHMWRDAVVSLLNKLKLQILLHGQKESIKSWSLHHFQMLKVYSTWKRMTATGMQERSEKNSVILVYHMLSKHHSLKIIHDMEMGWHRSLGSKMQFLAEILTKLFLEMIQKNWNMRLEMSKVEHCLRERLIFNC